MSASFEPVTGNAVDIVNTDGMEVAHRNVVIGSDFCVDLQTVVGKNCLDKAFAEGGVNEPVADFDVERLCADTAGGFAASFGRNRSVIEFILGPGLGRNFGFALLFECRETARLR